MKTPVIAVRTDGTARKPAPDMLGRPTVLVELYRCGRCLEISTSVEYEARNGSCFNCGLVCKKTCLGRMCPP